MSGQQRGSVILVPEHLAGALTKLMSDFITGQDVTLSGGNIAVKIRDAINQTPGGGDVAILSSLFALWNALPTSGRQSSRDDLIPAAVQALTTAHNLCLGVIPGETSHKDTPESLLRAIVTGLQKLWVDSCGCPECLQCLKGLKAIKPGLYEIPRIIPHTKQCSPVNLLNMLVHKLVALRGHVQLAYDARVLTPDFHEIPDLDDSDAVFARTLLAALFHLNMFFILKDYITQDSMSLKQALSGHWMSATGNPVSLRKSSKPSFLGLMASSNRGNARPLKSFLHELYLKHYPEVGDVVHLLNTIGVDCDLPPSHPLLTAQRGLFLARVLQAVQQHKLLEDTIVPKILKKLAYFLELLSYYSPKDEQRDIAEVLDHLKTNRDLGLDDRLWALIRKLRQDRHHASVNVLMPGSDYTAVSLQYYDGISIGMRKVIADVCRSGYASMPSMTATHNLSHQPTSHEA